MDPPWPMQGGGKIKRGADKHYKLMSIREITEFCRKEIMPKIDQDCHLYLWVTNNHLQEGLNLMKDMGLRYITNLAWLKDKIGIGQYFRGAHELCLFGVQGKFTANSARESSIIKGKRTQHSKKPYDMYRKAEEVSDPPRLEVFARHRREGWDVIGNEVPNEEQKLLRL